MNKAVIIAYDELSQEALHGLVEEFVTRDGTDYGEFEVSVETKISQIISQLKSGKVTIVFDLESQTPNILRSTDPAIKVISG